MTSSQVLSPDPPPSQVYEGVEMLVKLLKVAKTTVVLHVLIFLASSPRKKLDLCQSDVAVSHLFVAEIKDSELQTERSGVLLAIARPQRPPETTARTGGSGFGVLALPGVWLASLPCFWAVLPSVPTLPCCTAESAYTSDFVICFCSGI